MKPFKKAAPVVIDKKSRQIVPVKVEKPKAASGDGQSEAK